ncbi:hypothetical protein D3C73_1305930 [compost metagenome]
MDHTSYLGHVPVDVGVRCGIGGRGELRVAPIHGAGAPGVHSPDGCAVQVSDHHELRRELVIGDAGWLDDHEVVTRDTARHVACGPNDQFVAGQFGMQIADVPADLRDGFQKRAHADAPSNVLA